MKKFRALGGVAVIFLTLFLVSILSKYLFYRDSFNGVIRSVHYENKGLPTVIVNGESHLFPFGTKGAMKVGDSLVKIKNSIKLKLYRKGVLEVEYEWGIYDRDRVVDRD